jgi:hypothetical protein
MTCRNVEIFYRQVRGWTSAYSRLWFNASGNPPLDLCIYSRQEQRELEKRISAVRRSMPYLRKGRSFSGRGRGLRRMIAFIAQGFPGPAGTQSRRFLEKCGRAGEKFVARARAFDPDLTDTDIQQALRNLWVFNSLQYFLGRPVSLTPSSFAYSLLYPYVDNWLDRTPGSHAEKQELFRWLSSTICGRSTHKVGPREERIATLLGMVGTEHPRSRQAAIRRSLLGIHRAQKRALGLRGPLSNATEHALIPLTIEKGGTSVLVDGFLVDSLSAAQSETIFGYGVLLQLVDDLQDLREDAESGDSTPFSRAIRHGTLEGISNRLFNLVGVITASLRRLEAPREGHLTDLVERSCTLLIQEAIARHARSYRKGYLAMVDRQAPVRLAFLRRLGAR